GASADATPSATPEASVSEAGYVREGLVGYHGPRPFRVEVTAGEQHEDLTVLRMQISNTAERREPGGVGNGGPPGQRDTYGRLRLLGPVGRKVCFTLREKSDGPACGTRHHGASSANWPEDFQPGVRYPVEVYFPPLPRDVTQVSLVPDLAMAPTTGIPVT